MQTARKPMSHRPHLGWSILGFSLLVLIISVLVPKFSPGLLRDLSDIAFFGIPLGVVGVITGIIIALHERGEARHEAGVIDELRAGQGVLVHWSYTPEEWNGFVAKVIGQRKKELPWKILLVPLPMVGFFWVLFGEVRPVIFIPVAVIAFFSMLIYFQSRALAKLGRGDVIISRDGALLHDRWYDWSYGNRLLTGVTYEEGNPASISFKWVRVSGSGAWGAFSPTDVIVPVPHGHEKEAAHLVSTLSPNAKQHDDRRSSPESMQPIGRSVPSPLPPSNRPVFNMFAEMMVYTGLAASVLALAAALGEGSWAILGVAVSLIIFEVCAVFWGPSGGSAFALQTLIQIALFSTFLYGALNSNRNHPYFSSSWLPTQTIWEARKKLSSQPEQALQLFNAAVRYSQTPKDAARAYHERGDAYIILGQTQRAISDYDQAIVLDPNDAYYYSDRGKAYQALGKAEQAQRDFDKAEELRAAK